LSQDYNFQLWFLSRLMVVNLLTQALVFGLIWWIGSLALGTTMTKSSWIVVITYTLFSFL